jgi:hypothetical protein
VAASGSETSLVVGEGALGRGVFTTAPAREGDMLLRVPLRNALCVTTGGSRATVETLLKQAREYAPPPADGSGGLSRGGVPRTLEDHLQDRKVAPSARLAAWLLWALGAAPAWRAAAALLPPRDFRVDVAVRETPAAHAAYAAAVKADASLAVTADDFAWALSCVASRTFGADAWTRGDRDGVLGLMVPLADFLNHRACLLSSVVRACVRGRCTALTSCAAACVHAGFNPNCEFRLRNEAGVFEVFARRGISAGAPHPTPNQPRNTISPQYARTSAARRGGVHQLRRGLDEQRAARALRLCAGEQPQRRGEEGVPGPLCAHGVSMSCRELACARTACGWQYNSFARSVVRFPSRRNRLISAGS